MVIINKDAFMTKSYNRS